MSLLAGFRVAQIGEGMAAAVCGRLFADVGAEVAAVAADRSTPLGPLSQQRQDEPRRGPFRARGDRIGRSHRLRRRTRGAALRQHDAESLRRLNATAALVFISPFGQTGPRADEPATDLTLFCASGIARLLTGQVDDLAEPPIRPVGEQSAFIGGLAAACAGMHAALAARSGAVIDVSIQEALATLAMTELARAGLTGKSWSRKRLKDGNGATVTILPARTDMPRSRRARTGNGLPGWRPWARPTGAATRASPPRPTASRTGTRCMR